MASPVPRSPQLVGVWGTTSNPRVPRNLHEINRGRKSRDPSPNHLHEEATIKRESTPRSEKAVKSPRHLIAFFLYQSVFSDQLQACANSPSLCRDCFIELKMRVSVQQAEDLANQALQKLGYSSEDTALISHHLIDSELRGYGIAGLARILSIADKLGGRKPPSHIEVTRESPTSAQLNGHDTLGYLVAHKATKIAIEKAKASGVSAVGANGTYYTGMLSYYAEMAAAEDLVTIIASNCTPWVAPEGTYKPLVGTNPFCIGVPTEGVPIIYDIGTSRIIHAQVMLAKRKGEQLPPDTAYDEHGEMTTDPDKALKGALTVWGGARGSGLAVAVQLLGILAGSPALPPNLEDFGYFIMVIDPAKFRPMGDFKREVGNLVEAFHSAPSMSANALRMPFERSNRRRAEIKAGGILEVDDVVVDRLEKLIKGT